MHHSHYQRLFSMVPIKEYLSEAFSTTLFDKHGLYDAKGNRLALYKDDYLALKKYVFDTYKKSPFEVSTASLMSAVKVCGSKVIRYISNKEIPQYALDIKEFNKNNDIRTLSGIQAIRENHQNCFVYDRGEFYMHPKLRSKPGTIEEQGIGMSHSSFSHGKRIEFAGSLVNDGKGWILENSTGHYATRIVQLRKVLMMLVEKGMDVSQLRVRSFIAKKPGKHAADDEGFDITLESADNLLARTNKSILRVNQHLEQVAAESPGAELSSQGALKGSCLDPKISPPSDLTRTA